MTLQEAKRTVRTWRLIGGAILIVVPVVVILVVLKLAYVNLPSSSLFPMPVMRNVYAAIQHLLTSVPPLFLIWPLIPTVVGAQNFYFTFMSTVVGLLVGRGLFDYANKLNRRIKKAQQDVEAERWKQSMGHSTVGNIDVIAFQLGMVPSENTWYQKPVGILLLGLAVEVIGGLLLLLVN